MFADPGPFYYQGAPEINRIMISGIHEIFRFHFHFQETNAQNKAILYLKLWYDDKKGVSNTKWKFQKCKQIWLLSHCFDNKKIPAKEFKLLIGVYP